MKTWLKFVAVAILLYVVIASFLTPLVPGGMDVETEVLKPGTNEFVFVGYNTHFKDESNAQVFVAVDSTYYCTEVVEAIDNTHLKVRVELPDTISSKEIAFYANTSTDGTVYVRKAIGTDAFVIVPGYGNSCAVTVANDEHTGFGYPFQIIIYETIRNLMFHVPMWFTMFFLMIMSFVYSIKTLNKTGRSESGAIDFESQVLMDDVRASQYAATGLFFCVLGLITGSIWARFAWGDWWTNDPQLNGAMAVFIVYVAYFILRSSINDDEKRARLSAIYNIFAAVLMVVLLMVMPRFAGGLHPGKSGNPAFSQYDLDSSLRTVFYPAVIGWGILGYWLYTIRLRIKKLEMQNEKN